MSCAAFKQGLASVVASAAMLWGASAPAVEQDVRDAFDALRSDLRADRTALIAQHMQLNAQESEGFWPIYRSYRAEMDKVNDDIVKLILEYADAYPNVPDEKASQMVKKYMKIEANALKVRARYLKKLGKVLPGAKVFRFAQLDNRLDLGIRVGLAAEIPVLGMGKAKTKAE